MRSEAARSALREVRNPLLGLPAAIRLQALPPEIRQQLADILKELSIDARARAEEAWKRHKSPMAIYWRATSTYAGHLSRVVRPRPDLRRSDGR